MSSPEEGWQEKVSAWAHSRDDIKALVQIGSRVQKGAVADAWSDYDYHLITTRPAAYRSGAFARELGVCWAYGAESTFGNVVKATGVYEGGLEADFVVLRHAEVLVAMAALSWPSTEVLWPRALASGIRSLRVVAGHGWKVIKGGANWENRYARVAPCTPLMTAAEFEALCGEFWVQLVWAAKKAQRGEWIACRRAFHRGLVERCLRICQEEATLNGRRAFAEGRRAEQWLVPGQFRALGIGTGPEGPALRASLAHIADDFARASGAVAAANNWPVGNYREVRAWLGAVAGG
jgi:aminoglycoside 6-adenylyltransferase